MADAYNVRTNGSRWYVYRLDGNVQVAEYFSAQEAQIDAARRNQRHNETFPKKKEEQSTVTHTESWIEGGDEPETVVGHETKQPLDTRFNPTDDKQVESLPAHLKEENQTVQPKKKKTSTKKSKTPNPPPGKGVNY